LILVGGVAFNRDLRKRNAMNTHSDCCAERNLPCEYEQIKPWKRKRTSALTQGVNSHGYTNDQWDTQPFHYNSHDPWDLNSSYAYAIPESYAYASAYNHEDSYGLDNDVEEYHLHSFH
jgi:hypothetical protein